MARDKRRLTTIVSADVVGYSRLMGRDESGTLASLKAHLRELIDPKITEYGGRTVKSMGDGLLLEFPSVVDAVRCAVDVQRGMAERNAHVPPEEQIVFRVGVNVGDIIIDGDDIFGDGVNVAARLQTLAEPGGICASRAVRDQVLDKLSFAFEDLGVQEVKNIARPVEVYRIRDDPAGARADTLWLKSAAPSVVWSTRNKVRRRWAIGVVALVAIGMLALVTPHVARRLASSAPPALSVAIFPFTAPTANEDDTQIASALTRDVASTLSQNSWVTSVSQLHPPRDNDTIAEVRAIGRTLNVRYVAYGGVSRAGERVQAALRLVDVETGATVWNDKVEFTKATFAEQQSSLAVRLGRRLFNALYDAEMRRASHHSVPGSAWDLVLRGDFEWKTQSWESSKGREAARQLYDQALQIDPNFEPALVSMVNVWRMQLYEDLDADRNARRRWIEEIDRLSARAISIAPSSSSAWYERAEALKYLGRLNEALAANAKGREVSPINSLLVAQQSDILLAMGRPDDALLMAERAVALERGLFGEEAYSIGLVCVSKVMLGRYAEAADACEASATRGNSWYDQVYLTAVYSHLGEQAKSAKAKGELLKRKQSLTIEKLKAVEAYLAGSTYAQLAETHLYAGLRSAGVPER